MTNIEWLENLCISEISFINTYKAHAENYPMTNYGRHHHGLLYTVDGTEIYNFNDRKISTEPDTILYIPKDEKYTIDFEGTKSVVTGIEFEFFYIECQRPFCIKVNRINEMKSLFSDIYKIWQRKKPNYSAMCKSVFYRIIGMLLNQESHYSNSDNYLKISEAVNYLHKHYLESSFRIETLFEISKISPKYFETLFFREFQATPKEYVIALKMELAKELLKSEKYSVGDVAFQLGYSDIYHFSKIFKAKTGNTPSEFKRWVK